MAPTQDRLVRRLRLRHRVHGHRPRRPHPQAHRRRARGRASQVSLLFTSYMAVMGVAMLGTGWVSSRVGAKRTLLLGLVVIIVGAGLAGSPGHRRAGSSPSAPCGVWATHCSSRPRWPPSSGGPRVGGAGDHPVRSRARCRHRDRPAARRLARWDLVALAVLRRLAPDGDRVRRHRTSAARDGALRRQDQRARPAARAAPPRPAHRRHHRAALQLRLLHPAGVHPVPARHGRSRDRPDLLRLGRGTGDLLGLPGATAAAPVRHGARRSWSTSRCSPRPWP